MVDLAEETLVMIQELVDLVQLDKAVMAEEVHHSGLVVEAELVEQDQMEHRLLEVLVE
jgi:hypothetical protein